HAKSADTRAPSSTSTKTKIERMRDAPTAATPTRSPSPLTVWPASEMKTKEANGKIGISQASSAIYCHLPFQQVDLVDVDLCLPAGDHQDDRKAHGGFRGGHRHDEHSEDLPQGLVRGEAGEGDQVDVDAVQHQLDAHQHPDSVGLGQRAVDAQAEHDRPDP